MNDETAWVAEFMRRWLILSGLALMWLSWSADDMDVLAWLVFLVSVGALAKWPYYATLARGRSLRGSIDSAGATPPDLSGSYRRLRPMEPLLKLLIPGLIAFGVLTVLARLSGF